MVGVLGQRPARPALRKIVRADHGRGHRDDNDRAGRYTVARHVTHVNTGSWNSNRAFEMGSKHSSQRP